MSGNDDEARQRDIERIKAEARAYALSDMTRKKERERAKFIHLPASLVGNHAIARRRLPPPQYPPPPPPLPKHLQHPTDPTKPYPSQHEQQQRQPLSTPYGYSYHYPQPPYHSQYPPAPQPLPHPPANETASGIASEPYHNCNKQPPKSTFNPPSWNFDDYDEEYGRFMKSLWDDALFTNDEEEDTEEFRLEKEDDDDDENDDDRDDEIVDADETGLGDSSRSASFEKQTKQPANETSPLDPDLFHLGEKYYQELEEELGWLEEEDMEAAVTTLLDPPKTPLTHNTSGGPTGKHDSWGSPATSISTQKGSPRSQSTPFREAARATNVTETQYKRLQQLLHRHYQLLLQQTVLAARAAPTQSKTMESASDLMQIVNHATGMLQDIDQHRRNAILSKVQQGAPQRLTRLQFSKTLEEQQSLETVFDVKGLKQLKETFDWIDKSVEVLKAQTQITSSAQDEATNDTAKVAEKADDSLDRLLPTDTDAEACQKAFKHVGATFEAEFLPLARDLSALFADVEEALGVDFVAPCTPEQNTILRKNRNLFTFGEDNLVLQGVNLYGEKQWILLADRLLPDRSVNIISQRYAKLCVMLFKANGVVIDDEGNLEAPAKYDNFDDVDEKKARLLRRVPAPAILNVHRWSLQEDITTLKAVPIFGTMWAEISSRYLPHRDRGHIRKRYLVLQRRIKAAVSREKRIDYTVRPKPPTSLPQCPSLPHATHSTVTRSTKGEIRKEVHQRGKSRPDQSDHPKNIYPPPLMNADTTSHRPRTPAEQSSTKKSPFVVTKSPQFHVAVKPAPSYELGLNQEDCSRAAFEKLVQDAGSRFAFEKLAEGQGGGLKHSIESDSESMVATNIVTKLSTAYPAEYTDNDDSNSRFSMLDSYRLGASRDAPSKSPEKAFFDEAVNENNNSIAMPPPSKFSAHGSIFESPIKAKKRQTEQTPTRAAVRLTANTPTAHSFCEFGSMLSPALKHLASPSLTLHTFPETSNLIKDSDFPMDTTAAPSHMFGVPQTPSSAKSSTSSNSDHGNKVTHFWGDSSNLMANDLEAISALNSLSSSPVVGNETTSPSKSLFSKVIGRSQNTIQPSTKKRKLKF
ncbi:hypothetical protein FisN_7Lh209 [Fistulifera solaris]|uniref:Myb-like domain-containing protein n=1 Tax=Fistulifera solaris TaxID=1519565 RepID=A0A1Z5JRK9_FISSO|nr:hypothetical protein FisN_7Lh209 [Fistulifera solaris]|eukprot:GAX16492.1 hypothetical protein FisN_7Lh209 [Fistulifera solaris]